ncbi:hypothetical protein FLONG3_4 [Fusarium longipes]|uniref:DUF7908 domain-containing protein n=1 Tax=Fusarium longipes TaxID=694270 RepID=A0A395TBH8_9HYPO|nr:hypothetical protein FLONG3_4 [Fusarium longipes]
MNRPLRKLIVGTLTTTIGELTTVATRTDTEATSTPTYIVEPAGRAVIFLIQTVDNERRRLHKRASNGFVGNDKPEVCTFATTFNLAEGQLFDEGLPIYYSGESSKEFSGQSSPPEGSISQEFTVSGDILAFRNAELPNGEASFCQDVDGQVLIIFVSLPPGCKPVDLVVYDAERCQNGRLIGLDEFTSRSSTMDATEVTSIRGSATTEETVTVASNTEEISVSTNILTSQSIDTNSQTSETEASATLPSFVTDTFASLSSTASESSQEPTGSSRETDPFSTTLHDSTTISSVQVTSQFSTISSGQASSDISDTTVLSEETTTTKAETTDTDTNTQLEASTTAAETSVEDTSTAMESSATIVETTAGDTTESGILSTTEAETTTIEFTTTVGTTTLDQTTTAEPTTTTADASEPQIGCSAVTTNPYATNGVEFSLLCNTGGGFSPLSFAVVESFTACLRLCAQNGQCGGVVFVQESNECVISSSVSPFFPQQGFDFAIVTSRP